MLRFANCREKFAVDFQAVSTGVSLLIAAPIAERGRGLALAKH
jgi:hypothetical protein